VTRVFLGVSPLFPSPPQGMSAKVQIVATTLHASTTLVTHYKGAKLQIFFTTPTYPSSHYQDYDHGASA